jgi:hypothetical protein
MTGTAAPLQPLAEGITVYVTLPELTASVLVKNCVIVLPPPAIAPVTLVALTVQLKVVPLTALGLLNTTFVVVPLQIV